MVKTVSNQSFEEFLFDNFYSKIGVDLVFNPNKRFSLEKIVPTEKDSLFRNQLIHGFVHDETAAIMGGVSRINFNFFFIIRYSNLEGYENSQLVIETTKKIDILTKQLVIQSKSLDDIEKLVKDKEKMLAAIPSIQPIKNNDLSRIASGFGMRTDPFDKSRKMHKGMDFSAPRNTPVYAASNGKIIRADSRSIGYGKHIRIDHGYGFVTLYAHLNSYNVNRGQTVKKGDIIGFVGNTGRSKGLHLHYEVIKDGKSVNPVNYFYGSLTAEEFDEVLRISVQENQSLD